MFGDCGPNKLEFGPGDDWFIEHIGKLLGIVLVVCELRADMPAWCFGGGFRSWNHRVHPCSLCCIKKKAMKTLECGACAAEEYTEEDYRNDVCKHRKVSGLTKHTVACPQWCIVMT